jgi:DNA-binding transcriptional LysR family regulator
MELRQLEYLIGVADERNFTRAAARMSVAQPGVSAQIRRLERELGHELLDRSGREIRPTEVGAAVIEQARLALAAIDNARAIADEFTGLLRGRVAVGMLSGCNSADVPRMLADFHHAHPAIDISLTEDTSEDLIAAVRAGLLDAAIVALGTEDPEGISTQTIVDESLVAVVGLDDPLATHSTITLTKLAGRQLVCLPRGTGIRSLVDDACAALGVRPRIAFEASDLQMLADLASRGLGVAIVPSSLAAANPTTLRALTVTRPALRGRVALAWLDSPHRAAARRALINHAQAAFAPPAISR